MRPDDERIKELMQDQITGMSGQFALSKYWTGSPYWFQMQRFFANQYPALGDGGCDLPGSNLDVKTSLIRTQLPKLEHHLWVRPNEYKPDTVYILGLLEQADHTQCVHLIGWAKGSELTKDEQGRYGIDGDDLHELPPTNWFK